MTEYLKDRAVCRSCGDERLIGDFDEDGRCPECRPDDDNDAPYEEVGKDAARFAALAKNASWWAGAKIVAAALKIDAMKLDEAGVDVIITNPKPLSLWYYDGQVQIPANTQLTVSGWHPPNGDAIFEYDGLGLPAGERGSNAQNMRIRVKDENRNELLLTTQELANSFVVADQQQPEEEDLSQPGMPGESVFDLEPRKLGPETDSMKPTPSDQTNAQRPRPIGDPSMTTREQKAPTSISQPQLVR